MIRMRTDRSKKYEVRCKMSEKTIIKRKNNIEMNDSITRNEILNDGKTIHLYFNGMVGLYVTYGI